MKSPGVNLAAKRKRIDPVLESYDADEDIGLVVNKDPGRHYVWAYKVGNAIGQYEAKGYDIETHRPDGPRAKMTPKKRIVDDAPVEWNDNVLMSCPLEVYEEIVARGQRKTDRMEAALISQDGPSDPSRGIHRFQPGRTAVGLVNETSAAVAVDEAM